MVFKGTKAFKNELAGNNKNPPITEFVVNPSFLLTDTSGI
jgi:hypothetical protein